MLHGNLYVKGMMTAINRAPDNAHVQSSTTYNCKFDTPNPTYVTVCYEEILILKNNVVHFTIQQENIKQGTSKTAPTFQEIALLLLQKKELKDQADLAAQKKKDLDDQADLAAQQKKDLDDQADLAARKKKDLDDQADLAAQQKKDLDDQAHNRKRTSTTRQILLHNRKRTSPTSLNKLAQKMRPR